MREKGGGLGPPLAKSRGRVMSLKKSQPAALAIFALRSLVAPRGVLSGASPDLIPFLIGLPVEYILISFGDVVTALCLGTPESSNFDKDFNKKHNAKMMLAWS